MNKKQGRFFYGWYVVFACFLIMGVSVGLINNSSGVYIKLQLHVDRRQLDGCGGFCRQNLRPI